MAKIKVKRGLKSDLPLLDSGEFGFATDENELFIGNQSKNSQVAMLGENAVLDIKYGGTGAKTAQEALYKLGCKVRENLLDNWYFGNPVNQKGKKEYTLADGTTIDRWKIYRNSITAKITLKSDGIFFEKTGDGASYAAFDTNILNNKFIEGKPLTCSAIVDGQMFVFNVPNDWTCEEDKTLGNVYITTNGKTMSFSLSYKKENNILLARFYYGGSAKIETTGQTIQAVKLEIGENQTLAWQGEDGKWNLFETPDYMAELAKCQMYLFAPFRSDGTQGYIGPLQSNGGNVAYGMLYMPTTIRIRPTIVCGDYGRIRHWHPTDTSEVTEISTYGLTNAGIQIQVKFNGTLPAGYAGYLYASGPYDNLLLVSAEL